MENKNLSSREIEVSRLVAQGWSNKKIAQYLQLSDRTVTNHLNSVFNKLELSNRVQLAIVFSVLPQTSQQS